MGRKMAEINKRQAYVIDGAEVMPNERGTAPGQWLDHEGACNAPSRAAGRVEADVRQQCCRGSRQLPKPVDSHPVLPRRGMGESDLDQLISRCTRTTEPCYHDPRRRRRYSDPPASALEHAEQAEALVAEVGRKIEGLLGEKLYSRG